MTTLSFPFVALLSLPNSMEVQIVKLSELTIPKDGSLVGEPYGLCVL